MKFTISLVALGVLFLQYASGKRIDAVATMKSSNGVSGEFNFSARTAGHPPVNLQMEISGIKEDEYYTYHIHEKAVPRNGSCKDTGDHLDPLAVNKKDGKYSCKPSRLLKTCELGDLAGIYGNATRNSKSKDTYKKSVVLNYLIMDNGSLSEADAKFNVLGRSIVIHDKSNNRIACGNITIQDSS
ncbi:hypothetical protein BB560_004392 [Smittium megazygosporum]|uniref:Superoxide dismutase copper/zinc binding domain-containing protein n=1 Tax=Smittium megazygosporum TaxID=133381 RepID=A0A2T9Z9B6_9FUNG|nr:hypothetical protein BB560_004392 [Smittium megazygosporum]